MSLSTNALSFAYSSTPVLHDISLQSLEPGSFSALIGPNAAGKSTLFKCIAALLETENGAVDLDGKSVQTVGRQRWSSNVCYMPQSFTCNAALSVFEIVLLARKHRNGWNVTDKDIAIVGRTLRELNIEHLSQTHVGELSGGQQQMVSIAQALVRTPKVLLLDEPTSALDLRHQLEILHHIHRITVERQIVTIVALHDLNLAARFAERILLMRKGRVIAQGTAAEVLSLEALGETYGVDIELQTTKNGVLCVAASL
ncbi:MAG: ABC transporter ATP-binding protein [Stappiaceae bacterium]